MNTKKWKCKDGTKIRIKDMSDKHLINTIKFLERIYNQLKLLCPYPNFQGEMAQYYAEIEYDQLMESHVSDSFSIYDDMKDEAERRRLTIT